MSAPPSTDALYLRYREELGRFIQGRVKDAALADDILHDVFERTLTRLPDIAEDQRLRGWLYRVTKNAIVDAYRKRRVHEPIDDLEVAAEPTPDDVEETLGRCVRPLIETLPEKYRNALLLSELEGLTQAEVAEREGISLSGAKSRVQRGRAMLKEQLQRYCVLELDHRGVPCDVVGTSSCGSC